jgi:hypothetical protein
LADAPQPERDAVNRLLNGTSWARRAVAAVRLERFGCEASRQMLVKCLGDPAWQVRVFAIRSLARRGEVIDAAALADEQEPRVVRAALRYRTPIDPQRVARGARFLARSSDLDDKMLAAELAAAVPNDDDMRDLAIEQTRQVILKMDRAEAGVLSPRLQTLTGQRGIRRHYQWQEWLMKKGRRFEVRPAYALDEGAGRQPLSMLAELDSEQFVGVEAYMTALGRQELDLAVLIDCTASMFGEISAAQGGLDELMVFAGDLVSSIRLAVVGYRDRRDEFETKAWDFTGDIEAARKQLWTLTADGGGDHPEAVYPALKLAFTQLTWRPESTKVLILVGDAPPHIGLGKGSIDLARQAHEDSQVTTHTIQAEGKPVEHFDTIAEAGGGRCVSLEDDDLLVAEITGLTLGDRYQKEFQEFFQAYLALCR